MKSKLSVSFITGFLADHSCGAQVIFLGNIRDLNKGLKVTAITFDVYVPLAIKVLQEIADEAETLAGEYSKVIVQHRSGYVGLGETSLAIGVCSPHRDEAFKACRLIIEEVKKRVPIWKLEHYEDGSSKWLQGYSLTTSDHQDS